MQIARTKTKLALIGLTGVLLTAYVCWQLSSWSQPSIENLRQQCQQALLVRKHDQAVQLSKQWTVRDPQNVQAWLVLAEALASRNEFQLAAESLARVPSTVPNSISAKLALMELQFGPLNRPREGALTAEQILQAEPQLKVAQQRLIFFLTMTLQRSRLNQQIRSAFEANSEPRESYVYLFFLDSLFFANGAELNGHWLLGEPDSELFEVGEAIFIAETLDASISMDDSDASHAAQRAASRKVEVLEKLLQKYPHNSELLAYEVRQCILTSDVARAVKLLSQATSDAEQDNRFWKFKGWVHAQTNEPQEAEVAYQHALKLHPLDSGTRHLLAELLQRQQRHQEVEHLRKLVSLANEIRRQIHRAPSARQIPADLLSKLADYAAGCGDKQTANLLRRRIRQYFPGSEKQNSN
jgi:cytochrome c-type biogenesis protein CcmH/NrfG